MKKIRPSKMCSQVGHDWPLVGSNMWGEPIKWYQCRRCGKINEKRRVNIVNMQLAMKEQEAKLKKPWYLRWWNKIKLLFKR